MSAEEPVIPDYLIELDDGTGDRVKIGVLGSRVVLEVHNEERRDYFGVLLSKAEAVELGFGLGIAAKRAERGE